jgi:hypothetical protein
MQKRGLFIVAALLILCAAAGFGQFKMSIGPNVGLGWNSHSITGAVNSVNGFGFVAGAQVDLAFSKEIGLIVNLQAYDNRHGKESEPFNNGTLETNVSVAYFTIEPLFKFTIPETDFFLFAGPTIGFNTSANVDQTYTPNGGGQAQNGSGTLQNMNTQFDIKGGAGYNIPLGGISLVPQLSMSYGMNDVQSNLGSGNSWKILNVQALATLKIPVIK